MWPLICLIALGPVQVFAQNAGGTFYHAVRSNDLAAINQAIRKDRAAAKESGRATPLMIAAAIGSLDAMKLVVAAGADVNAINGFGATALMWCAGDLAKVRYLLGKGASVTARSTAGRTPLAIAANYDGPLEIGRLMIGKGADAKAKDKSGATPLHAAAFSNNLEFARLLLTKGADANAKDGAGFTALTVAALNGDRSTAMVKLLLDHGAAANVVSIDSLEMMKNGPLALGRLTPLHFAAGQANFETVELLVKAGADVNAQDIRGSTPLAFAVATDHADARIVSLLHAKGAALDLARMYRNPEVLTALGLPAPAKIEEPASAMAPARGIAASLEKGIAVLQASSPKFLERGGCPACHAQHHTAVAAAAAKASGVKVDWAQEIEQAGVTASLRGGIEQQLFQVIDPPPGVDGMEFSLLQTSAAGLAPKLATDSLVFFIAAMQRKEGDWPNYGVVRPPLEDGGFSHTAKGIRVLQQNLLPGRKAEFEERIARAAGWLEKSAPRTTEDRTMQLLGIRWANRNAPESRVRELIALQRASGGWGQTENLPSDAYATGEALYALHETGMPATDAVYRRGAGFLLRTQHEDGSWLVKTRAAGFQPYFESGFPHGHDQWISQSGTAWAAIALSYANQ